LTHYLDFLQRVLIGGLGLPHWRNQIPKGLKGQIGGKGGFGKGIRNLVGRIGYLLNGLTKGDWQL